MRNLSRFALVIAGAFALAASAAPTPVLQSGEYRLNNHRNGGQQPPGYGLRLDGLDGSRNPARIFSFDFNDSRSDMRMALDLAARTIRIFGTVWGGHDNGSTYAPESQGRVGLWRIEFLYDTNVVVQSDGTIAISRPSNLNVGYIQPLFSSTRSAFRNNPQIPLVDFNMDPYAPSFYLGLNHRTNPGVSGWGWLNHSGQSHIAASDWLFEVDPTPIPSPVSGSLAIVGMAALAGLRRRLS